MAEARWVDAALHEYDAHRAEIVGEAAAQQQILALGATAIGVAVAGGFNVWDDELLASVAFLGVVPALCIFVLVQWAGRAAAMMRVGVYLQRLETVLLHELSARSPVLTWEETLASMPAQPPWRLQPGWNDFGAVAVFASFAAGSLALGAYRAWDHAEVATTVVTVVNGGLLVLVVNAVGRGVAAARKDARGRFPEPRTAAPSQDC